MHDPSDRLHSLLLDVLTLIAHRDGAPTARRVCMSALKRLPPHKSVKRASAAYEKALRVMWETLREHPDASNAELYAATADLMTRREGKRADDTYERVLKRKWPAYRAKQEAVRRAALVLALQDPTLKIRGE